MISSSTRPWNQGCLPLSGCTISVIISYYHVDYSWPWGIIEQPATQPPNCGKPLRVDRPFTFGLLPPLSESWRFLKHWGIPKTFHRPRLGLAPRPLGRRFLPARSHNNRSGAQTGPCWNSPSKNFELKHTLRLVAIITAGGKKPFKGFRVPHGEDLCFALSHHLEHKELKKHEYPIAKSSTTVSSKLHQIWDTHQASCIAIPKRKNDLKND